MYDLVSIRKINKIRNQRLRNVANDKIIIKKLFRSLR